MTSSAQPDTPLDDQSIERIATRVADMLKTELQTIAAELATASSSGRPLTVGEVADRFGLARSTVYTHWREWGGYKLGSGDKATIRFDQQALPERPPDPAERRQPSAKNSGARRKRQPGRRDLLRARPRFPRELDAEALTRIAPSHPQATEQTGD